MSKPSFEEMDEQWQKALEKEREKEVSPDLLKNFSSSVIEKIEEKEEKKTFRLPAIVSARTFVPVFTILLLASFLVIRLPFESATQTANASEIEEDIAELRELGAWNEEDEQSVGISGFEALEISSDSA
jgi:hypothetical protein